MRTVAGIILALLTVPLFLIGLLTATFKFQLLSPQFWENIFEKNNTYTELTTIIKQSVIDQTVKEGGRPGEIKSITELISTENVKDFVNRNLENILNYARGNAMSLLVYVPVSRVPKGLLPKTFENLPETMSLSSLLSRLNIKGIPESQIKNISLLGRGSTYLLILDSALFILFEIILFVLTKPGERFIGPGISLILNGLTGISMFYYGNRVQASLMMFVQKTNTLEVILGTVTPPLIHEAVKVWLIAGIVALLFGVILILVKRNSQPVSS